MRAVRALAGPVAAAAVLLAAAPAHAAELGLSDVEVAANLRSLSVTVTGSDLPAGTGLDPGSVRVDVDGRTLPTSSVVAAAEEVAPPRVLLVVDTSGSMNGGPIAEAKQAISTFLVQAPAQAEIGLLAFSTTPRLLVPPTKDRSRLLGAVTGLQAQGETSLYDAVAAGVRALGSTGDRRLVVLSDGGDTRSRTGLADALGLVRGSGVVLDAIGYRTDESVEDVLGRLATSGRGRVRTTATASELATALAASVRPQARALTLDVLVPTDLRGAQRLEVTVGSGAGRLSARTDVTIGTAAAPAAREGWWDGSNALAAGLAAIALSLLLGTLAVVGGSRGDRRKTHAVLDRFTTAPAPVSDARGTGGAVARTALELAGRVSERRSRSDRTELRLARAAVSLTPAEFLLLQAGAGIGVMLVLVLLGWNLLLAALLALPLGALIPSAVLGVRGARRQRAFEAALPDALQMTAGSLSAGYSLAQALDGLVREGSEPMATEIGRALAESRLGVPVEQTLQGVAERMDSRDFAWVVMAIRVQREVGGNLAGVLQQVSATMRERAMLRRHVQALSAEGRLSAYILLGLPIGLGLYLLGVRREYLEPLWTTAPGVVMVVLALVLMTTGSFVMSRMVKVEV